jgi:hypothetical protein
MQRIERDRSGAAWRPARYGLQERIGSIEQTARVARRSFRIGSDQCAATVLANQPLSQVFDAHV